jgi:hypothetical protein
VPSTFTIVWLAPQDVYWAPLFAILVKLKH